MNGAVSRLSRRLPQPAATDRELLARVASSGDDGAFAALVGRHGRAVLAACRHVLAEPADVDDAFQATFLLLFRRAGRVRWQESAGGWLYAAAHRLAVRARADRHRRAKREATASRPERTDGPDPSWREAVAVLHAELDELPDRHRLPLILCYLGGRSRDEAAAELGWTAAAVKGCLERGRKVLADRLRRRGIDLSAGLLAVLAARGTGSGVPPNLLARTTSVVGGTAPPAVAALVQRMTPMTLLPKAVGLTLAGALGLAAVAAALPRHPTADDVPKPPPAVAAAAKPVADPADDDEPAEVESVVAGRVLGPNDQPVPGAAVYWLTRGPHEGKPLPRVHTVADGSFRFAVRHPSRDYTGTAGHPWLFGAVGVTADGFGFGWLNTPEDLAKPVVRLVRDDQPVRGTVVDAAGKGVAGVTVRCRAIRRPWPGTDFADWVAAGRKGQEPPYLDGWYETWGDGQTEALLPRATTGPDGAFELPGVGRDRLAKLLVTGPTALAHETFAFTRQAEPFTITRPRPTGGTYDTTYHGLPAALPTTPAVPVVGTVTAADTGDPLPGVIVRAMGRDGAGTTAFLLQTTTGPDGAYRLDGLDRSAPAEVEFAAPGKPYHTRGVEVPAARGGEPAPVDVALQWGVFVNVKVREKGTGKPVRVERRYTVFADNPNVNRARIMPVEGLYVPVASDFQVVAYPGPGMLAVRAGLGGPYLRGVGGDLFPKYRQGDQILDGWPISNLFVREWNTIVPLNPGDEPVDLTVELDPGESHELAVVGPDGKPLAGTTAIGLRPDRWAGWRESPAGAARLKVRALEPDEPRRVVVAHEGKKLTGTAVVAAGAKGPTTITLKPWASVSGRMVDEKGQPAPGAGYTIGHASEKPEDAALGPVVGTGSGQTIRADKDGRFCLPGLVPGLSYQIYAWPPEPVDGRPRAVQAVLVPPFVAPPPGETKDVGDIRIGE